MKNIQFIAPARTCMVVIDPQERLMRAVWKPERVVKNINILLKAAELLGIPVIVTTQYRKGLGPVVSDITLTGTGISEVDKTEFNCFDNREFASVAGSLPSAVDTLILAGVEAHICVFQTAVAALNLGYQPWIASDAISSRSMKNVEQAIMLMQANSILCGPTETIVYQLLKKAGTKEFKALLPYLK